MPSSLINLHIVKIVQLKMKFLNSKNGKKTSTITLLKIMEMPAYLELQKQRFYCKSCDSHFTAKSNIVDAHCFISNKTKLAVLDKAQEYRSQNLSLSHA